MRMKRNNPEESEPVPRKTKKKDNHGNKGSCLSGQLLVGLSPLVKNKIWQI